MFLVTMFFETYESIEGNDRGETNQVQARGFLLLY